MSDVILAGFILGVASSAIGFYFGVQWQKRFEEKRQYYDRLNKLLGNAVSDIESRGQTKESNGFIATLRHR